MQYHVEAPLIEKLSRSNVFALWETDEQVVIMPDVEIVRSIKLPSGLQKL